MLRLTFVVSSELAETLEQWLGSQANIQRLAALNLDSAAETLAQCDILMLELTSAQNDATLQFWAQMVKQTSGAIVWLFAADDQQARVSKYLSHDLFQYLSLPLTFTAFKQAWSNADNYLTHRRNLIQFADVAAEDALIKPIALSPTMRSVVAQVDQVANMDIPLLLVGETGTGKNTLANYIHHQSARRSQPFFTLNCGTMPASLLDSELFGHEKGAFTGAVGQRRGLLEAANGGTLFLDEINSASLDLQVRLLHFIQDKKLIRVGGRKEIEVDVRLIFASNTSLKLLVEQGRFREDLYFRLNVFPITLPPLRERQEDIAYLAARILFHYAAKFGKPVNACGPGVLEALKGYAWPGNVRELENVMQRALILCQDTRIHLSDLPNELQTNSFDMHEEGAQGLELFPEDASLEDIEKLWIKKVIHKYQGNKLKACSQLGISPTTLWRKLKQ